MFEQRNDHYTENDDGDGDAPLKDHHVSVVGFEADVSHAFGHIQHPFGIRRAGRKEAEQAQKWLSFH